ncbi:conserved hypothetical protein [Methylotenera versatilis 301]|uniref:Reverse transcriptase domain-containing protein n=2 Tax=Methylotenera TaxID=359407 RepID=D7DL89_METV0|nr:conserved hypothetical protein [Methylotenera versatilis 301]
MPKQYAINQSPLYKLVGLRQLELCLGIDLERLDKLLKDGSYRTWVNDNDRAIQHPLGWLAQVHSKIAHYLAKIETPDYVYHKKGRSHVKNASEHTGYHLVAKTDISNYYPSITRAMLKSMFVKKFKCALDVAGILADICTYQRTHLATGSGVSGYLAFWASKDLFDAVYELSRARGCVFTLYVDDLTISGNAASKKLLTEVRAIVKRNGLKTKETKSKTFAAHATKMVTGVVLKGNESLLSNKRHKEIADNRIAIANTGNANIKATLQKSLKGRLMAAKQIIDSNEIKTVTSSDLIYS